MNKNKNDIMEKVRIIQDSKANKKEKGEAYEYLLNSFKPMLYKRVSSTYKFKNNFLSDDVYQEACIRLYIAAQTYDLSAGTLFSTWVYHNLKASLRPAYKESYIIARNYIIPKDKLFEDIVDNNKYDNDFSKKIDAKALFQDILYSREKIKFTENERKLIQYIYEHNCNPTKASRQLGFTRQNGNYYFKCAIEKLREYFRKNNFTRNDFE